MLFSLVALPTTLLSQDTTPKTENSPCAYTISPHSATVVAPSCLLPLILHNFRRRLD
ncbi:hypothetical protein TIFTF001_036232 [Ficus carica]|uniref:Uncharacterized protein n=1 Tax=Ficus carica TaxID=3494 RepID=A0AA88JAW8_FICCA|nr:hypothetical protein TIFTF001_036232 [Ficus carica]